VFKCSEWRKINSVTRQTILNMQMCTCILLDVTSWVTGSSSISSKTSIQSCGTTAPRPASAHFSRWNQKAHASLRTVNSSILDRNRLHATRRRRGLRCVCVMKYLPLLCILTLIGCSGEWLPGYNRINIVTHVFYVLIACFSCMNSDRQIFFYEYNPNSLELLCTNETLLNNN